MPLHHLPTSKEAPCRRTYFYVGGQYVKDNGSHILKDQIYVEQLDPVDGPTKPLPLVFVHGGYQTGTNWLNKPDGDPGWASFYLLRGYRVYIIDASVRGRSPGHNIPASSIGLLPAEEIESRFTATAKHKRWPQASLHTQWPGAGVMGDPIFDAYYASNFPGEWSVKDMQEKLQKAGAALLDKIEEPVVLFSHSQGMMPAWLIADARPKFIHAIVALEPSGPPFREAIFSDGFTRTCGITAIPLTLEPEVVTPGSEFVKELVQPDGEGELACLVQAQSSRPRRLINLVEKPVLVVTAEASYHAPYDWATVTFLRRAGVHKTEHMRLADLGVRGNGHMLFMEKNSEEIAELVENWIAKTQ